MQGSRPIKNETKKRVPLRDAIAHSFSSTRHEPFGSFFSRRRAAWSRRCCRSRSLSALIPLAIAYVGKAHHRCGRRAQSCGDTIHWVVIELACVAVLAACSQGLSLARQIVGARLGLDINLVDPRKSGRPRPAPLRGSGLLRSPHQSAS